MKENGNKVVENILRITRWEGSCGYGEKRQKE